ncbi:TetR family transcriptional regulator [Pseudomonas sp. EpS/L25]|uniref:TetR family transcriptional regulator n=1 Tax=Pseudomonas sp. EpS/L25 TaxID=1749078 RepID=UPI0007434F89|nr:TetR family transcriptional regulator [Pseudomonas sp. EpS/L25]KUM38715.1 TetR family transcriptional regulator [Pseudomonas sp. EpS/L25]
MSIRAQQKLQTRQALLESARLLMNSGRGFGSLSLREVSRQAGIVPAGFYRHFADMETFGLALVAEVGDTFRDALRQVRHHELQQRGMIEASVEIFLRAVHDNRDQFLFLAREQYGGSLAVRQAIAELRQRITQDLARDLLALGRLPHLVPAQIDVLADLVVKTVFATLPELIDSPPELTPPHLWPAAKMVQQLKLILIGSKHWRRAENKDAPKESIDRLANAMMHQIKAN